MRSSRPHAPLLRHWTHLYRPERPIQVVHNGSFVTKAPDLQRLPGVLTAGRLWDRGKNVALLDRLAARMAVPVRAAGPLAGPNGAFVSCDNLECLGTPLRR